MPESSPARFRAGQGEPVVLLHGFTATWRCWLPVVDALSARYDVLAPTLTGHEGGPPRRPDQGHSLAEAAGHVGRQLDEQSIDTAHLVGNSMGGALALELARQGRARSVVALSPGGAWDAGDPEGARVERFFRRQLRLTRASEARLPTVMARPRLRRAALRDIVTRGERIPAAEAVGMARASLRCEVVEDVFGAIRSGEGLLTALDEVRVPTLIAWAERDRILPLARNRPWFEQHMPHASFRVLAAVGHVPMSDDPPLVTRTIADWVDTHTA